MALNLVVRPETKISVPLESENAEIRSIGCLVFLQKLNAFVLLLVTVMFMSLCTCGC